MTKENLTTSMVKLIMAVCLIVGVGAVMGLMGYYMMSNDIAPTNVDQMKTDLTKSQEFSVRLNEEVRVIYKFKIPKTGVEKTEEFILSLKSIDDSQKTIGFNKHCFLKPNMSLNETLTCFVSEEGGAYFKLTDLNGSNVKFQTWFKMGEPHPVDNLLPEKIEITKDKIP